MGASLGASPVSDGRERAHPSRVVNTVAEAAVVRCYDDSASAEAVVMIITFHQVVSDAGPDSDVVQDGSVHVDVEGRVQDRSWGASIEINDPSGV